MNMSRPRILAIEADPDRRRQLERFLRERVNADVAVAESAPAAVRAIDFHSPDLVLASMLLPPGDDEQVMSHLKTIDDASRPPVLVVPPLHQPARPSPVRRLLHRLGLRRLAPFPLYDADAIGARIQDALEEVVPGRSRPQRIARRDSEPAAVSNRRQDPRAPLLDQTSAEARLVLPQRPAIVRAHRWNPAELPWVCTVQTPIGLDARVINVSRSGILIETGSKLPHGSIASVHLSGMGTSLMVPAHVVRSEVASVEVGGVKYWIAAAFNGRLDPLPEDSVQAASAALPVPAATLAELLARVASEIDRGRHAADVKAMFEEGVRQLASAHDVKLCEAPAPTSHGESIYFKVPGPSGSRAVLQVVFAAGHRPDADEFLLMRAAAAAAAVVPNHGGIMPRHGRSSELRNSW
jgi:CheY-like chemotaxis protein